MGRKKYQCFAFYRTWSFSLDPEIMKNRNDIVFILRVLLSPSNLHTYTKMLAELKFHPETLISQDI